jgi:GntR family transcriptional repressor for pyruvate dehydrogenase complex
MDAGLFQSVNDGSRTDRAVRFLTELITSGKLASGDFLPSESVLCKQLGISRPTVRLALRTLETQGLVTIKHGIGAQVMDRTQEAATSSIELMLQRRGSDTREMLEIRLLLECKGAALAATRASEADIAEIEAAIDAMRAEGLSIDDSIEIDLGFHLRVHEASKNAVLFALVHAIRSLLRDTIAAAFHLDPVIDGRIYEHSRILDAIKARDAGAASFAMEDHLRHSVERRSRAPSAIP